MNKLPNIVDLENSEKFYILTQAASELENILTEYENINKNKNFTSDLIENSTSRCEFIKKENEYINNFLEQRYLYQNQRIEEEYEHFLENLQ